MTRLAIILALLAGYGAWPAIYTLGEAHVRRHTVVEVEKPYFHGVFHGECAMLGGFQACATEDDDETVAKFGAPSRDDFAGMMWLLDVVYDPTIKYEFVEGNGRTIVCAIRPPTIAEDQP